MANQIQILEQFFVKSLERPSDIPSEWIGLKPTKMLVDANIKNWRTYNVKSQNVPDRKLADLSEETELLYQFVQSAKKHLTSLESSISINTKMRPGFYFDN